MKFRSSHRFCARNPLTLSAERVYLCDEILLCFIDYRDVTDVTHYRRPSDVQTVVDCARVIDVDWLVICCVQLWCNNHLRESVVPAIKNSLANLRLDYVDMYLIHWPIAFKVDYTDRPSYRNTRRMAP